MPNSEETRRIIEQAKMNKGVDMSWLRPQGAQIAGAVQGISPVASQLLEDVTQIQSQTPVYMPFPAGTPTQRRKEAEEQARQHDLAHELALRQQAHREWLDRQELALKAAGAYGGGRGYGAEEIAQTPWGAIDTLIQAGADIEDIMEYVEHPANLASYKEYGVDLNTMRNYALQNYESLWMQVADTTRRYITHPTQYKYGSEIDRQVREAEKRATRAAELKATFGQRFTEADYQRFAQETGRTVEEIRRMDELGWLEEYMRNYYGQQYKWAPPETAENAADILEMLRKQGLLNLPPTSR